MLWCVMQGFPQIMRHWRGQRRLSQLSLAAEAGVSPRHVSFLESGRARPSRDMVLKIAEALELPRAARNEMLSGVGFAALYPQAGLDAQGLAPVRAAFERIMARHDPYPAVLLDRVWTIRALNQSAGRLFGAVGLEPGVSVLSVLDRPGGGAALIENWAEAGHHLMHRLRAESRAAGGIDALDRAVARLSRDPAVAGHLPAGPLPPVIPTIYTMGGQRLPLFFTFVQIGGAEDIVLNDLRIELMFPMDEGATLLLERLAEGA